MNLHKLLIVLENKEDDTTVEFSRKEITVHTGGNNWEEIVEVVFCPECDQYHIISERLNGTDPEQR